MISIVIAIIAMVLLLFNVVNNLAFAIIVLSAIVLETMGGSLYLKFGILKFYYHDVLGWHEPDDSPHYSDGLSEHATCKYCGKDIMQDSQGNWF